MIPDQEYFHVEDYIFKENSLHWCYRRRFLVINFLEKVQSSFDLSVNTLHLSINYFDRCMKLTIANNKDLKLLAITCIYIASKFYESSEKAPTTKGFAYISSFTEEELIESEMLVLDVLQWRLMVPTMWYYIDKTLINISELTGRYCLILEEYMRMVLYSPMIFKYKTSDITYTILRYISLKYGLQFNIKRSFTTIQLPECMKEMKQNIFK